LEEHYSQGVIFPKYRNIIAVSAFYDYLASGRCDSLEGASGAYNLYETELRQNIIIAQLSLILKNINSIKDNQYSLYQELSKSNAEVNKIIYEVRELRDDTKMYAYLNSAMALAVATNI